MPVIDAVIVTILPDNGEGIGSHGNDIVDARGGCIPQLDVEYLRIRFGAHVLVPATAGGAGTSRPQQLKRIDARVIVVPGDRKFFGFLIDSNVGWFFVHKSP